MGAIIAIDGSSVWGKAGSFTLSAYETEIDDGEGGKKKVNVNEGQRVLLLVWNFYFCVVSCSLKF